MVLKLPKIVHFLQFYAALSKISQSVETTYVYDSERSHFALLEHGVVYRCLRYSLRIITVIHQHKIAKKLFQFKEGNWN